MEFVYKLKLPPITELLSKNILPNDDGYSANYKLFPDIRESIKSKYLDLLDISSGRILYFKKSDVLGTIHTDTGYSHETHCEYAFNWILNAGRRIEYWNWQDVIADGHTDTATNSKKGSAVRFASVNAPCATYELEADNVYLVQTSHPHRAYGYKFSKAISLRPYKYDKPWMEIVQKFSDLII